MNRPHSVCIKSLLKQKALLLVLSITRTWTGVGQCHLRTVTALFLKWGLYYLPYLSHEEANTTVDRIALWKKNYILYNHTHHYTKLRNLVRATHWLFHKCLNSLHILIPVSVFHQPQPRIFSNESAKSVNCPPYSIIFRNYLLVNACMQRIAFRQ